MSAKYVHSMKCEAGSDSVWRDELGEDLQIPRRMVIIKIASDNFYPGSEMTHQSVTRSGAPGDNEDNAAPASPGGWLTSHVTLTSYVRSVT